MAGHTIISGGNQALHRLSVFISYRRHDAFLAGPAKQSSFLAALKSQLFELGAAKVFLDVDEVHNGNNYDTRIHRQIADCDLFIVLIGRNWISELRHRLQDRVDDMAAREVRAALRLEKDIAPILVDDATMPSESELPTDLVELHYSDATSVASNASKETLAEALKPLVDRTRLTWKLGKRWTIGYVVVAIAAYLLCAVAPNVVGSWEYGEGWGQIAASWAGLYIWPALFLPFAAVAFFFPIKILIEAIITAERFSYAITYATPLLVGLVITGMALVIEVDSTDQTPWTIHPVFQAAPEIPNCGAAAAPYTSSALKRLIQYDAASNLATDMSAHGQLPPFWLRNKCWPNVFFYLTTDALSTPAERAERSEIQAIFVNALRTDNLRAYGMPLSRTFPFYVASFTILIFLGAIGVSMAVFFVSIRLRRPRDDSVRYRPTEDSYLCLTYAFISLLIWIPFRMVTVYTKHLYYCADLTRCHFNPGDYLNDFVIGTVFLIGYICISFGLLVQFRRFTLGGLGFLCVFLAVCLAAVVFFHGDIISRTTSSWRLYLGAAIPIMFALMALWFQFNPAIVQFNEFRRSLK